MSSYHHFYESLQAYIFHESIFIINYDTINIIIVV